MLQLSHLNPCTCTLLQELVGLEPGIECLEHPIAHSIAQLFLRKTLMPSLKEIYATLGGAPCKLNFILKYIRALTSETITNLLHLLCLSLAIISETFYCKYLF